MCSQDEQCFKTAWDCLLPMYMYPVATVSDCKQLKGGFHGSAHVYKSKCFIHFLTYYILSVEKTLSRPSVIEGVLA